MQLQLKIMICEDTERFMGQGPYQLLRLTDELGSLRRAAGKMGMSYSKAHALIKRLENCLHRQVLRSHTGGAAGGGAELTKFGRLLLQEYAELVKRLNCEAVQAFDVFCANLAVVPEKTEKL